MASKTIKTEHPDTRQATKYDMIEIARALGLDAKESHTIPTLRAGIREALGRMQRRALLDETDYFERRGFGEASAELAASVVASEEKAPVATAAPVVCNCNHPGCKACRDRRAYANMLAKNKADAEAMGDRVAGFKPAGRLQEMIDEKNAEPEIAKIRNGLNKARRAFLESCKAPGFQKVPTGAGRRRAFEWLLTRGLVLVHPHDGGARIQATDLGVQLLGGK